MQDVQVCARFNGGANAGHTLLVAARFNSMMLCLLDALVQFASEDGKKYAFHLLPCGMINKAE